MKTSRALNLVRASMPSIIDGDLRIAYRTIRAKLEETGHSASANMPSDEIADMLRSVLTPYIVKRPHGGCQVLFPLTQLDSIVESAASHVG